MIEVKISTKEIIEANDLGVLIPYFIIDRLREHGIPMKEFSFTLFGLLMVGRFSDEDMLEHIIKSGKLERSFDATNDEYIFRWSEV